MEGTVTISIKEFEQLKEHEKKANSNLVYITDGGYFGEYMTKDDALERYIKVFTDRISKLSLELGQLKKK